MNIPAPGVLGGMSAELRKGNKMKEKEYIIQITSKAGQNGIYSTLYGLSNLGRLFTFEGNEWQLRSNGLSE